MASPLLPPSLNFTGMFLPALTLLIAGRLSTGRKKPCQTTAPAGSVGRVVGVRVPFTEIDVAIVTPEGLLKVRLANVVDVPPPITCGELATNRTVPVLATNVPLLVQSPRT